jgi:tRNA(Ile)-lysidine synthase
VVLQAIADALPEGVARCVVGYSGGLDSTVLLWAAHRLAGSRVVAAHVNHGWHPHAFQWETHCEAFARELGVEFRSTRLVPGPAGNPEDQARKKRHAWLAGLLGAGDQLLLAHHQDDQVETALLRVLQGRGAYGMPVRRGAGAGELVRPFLGISRSVLRSVASEAGLRWIEDPANGDSRFDRAWLRHEILPRFRDRGDGVLARIADLANRELHRESAAIQLAAALPRALALHTLPSADEDAAAVVRWWLLAQGGPSTASGVLRDWLRIDLHDGARDRSLSLGRGRLIRYQSRLYWQDGTDAPGMASITTSDGEIRLPHGRFSWRGVDEHAGLCVNVDQPDLPLTRGVGSTTVRALLQRAVLPWERVRYPLVLRSGALVCIPGVAQGDAAAGVFRFVPDIPVFRADFEPDDP